MEKSRLRARSPRLAVLSRTTRWARRPRATRSCGYGGQPSRQLSWMVVVSPPAVWLRSNTPGTSSIAPSLRLFPKAQPVADTELGQAGLEAVGGGGRAVVGAEGARRARSRRRRRRVRRPRSPRRPATWARAARRRSRGSRESVARCFAVAAVARVLQLWRQAIYRTHTPHSLPPPRLAGLLPRETLYAVCVDSVNLRRCERARACVSVPSQRAPPAQVPRERPGSSSPSPAAGCSVVGQDAKAGRLRRRSIEATRNGQDDPKPAPAGILDKTASCGTPSRKCGPSADTAYSPGYGTCRFEGLSAKRMMGLEPTTFCMASVLEPSARTAELP